MGGRLGATIEREDLPDPLIREIIDFALDHDLDLSASRVVMNPWDIQVEERVDPAYVRKLAKALDESEGWPEAMPLSVISSGATPMIMDGSHRTTAARVTGFEKIPVLLISSEAYYEIADRFDISRFDYVHSVLPDVDPLMKENERKDEGAGHPKKRTAEPWDMDAFGGTISMGAAGHMSQSAAMALDLRNRVLTLHEDRRALFPKEQWMSMNRCLVDKTTPASIARIASRILPPTFTREAAQDAEAVLIGKHGSDRYANQILLRRHVNDTLQHFRISLMMNEILKSCGYGSSRPEALLEMAAGRMAQ